MDYKKPQSTIVHGGAGIYPLTTADQVILADGSRLEKDGKISADSAADSAKLGGKAPEYYIQPRNLLDNSDFRNPVNQRGRTTYNEGGYTIDRYSIWSVNDDASLTLVEGGIAFNPGSGGGTLTQRIPLGMLDSAKTYTLAVHKLSGETEVKTDGVTFNFNESCDLVTISGLQETIIWAALYEGAYTVDTLPPYVPKGYAAELAECQRYFERLGSTFSERIGTTVYVVSGAKSFVCSLQCSRKRISHPSVSISGIGNYRLLLKDATNANTYSAVSISSIDDITTQEPFISFRVNTVDAITQNSWIQLQRSDGATAAYIDVSADL